jgi:O-antigen/teichoic acid export membrane protein
MNVRLKQLNVVLRKFGVITILKGMSALGIFASSFYISSSYGLSEFGDFSYILVLSGLILVVSRMGAEYTTFKFFLPQYESNKKTAFEWLQRVIVNSLVLSISFLVIIILILDLPETLINILILHTLTFSVIQPFSFALRSIKKFKVAYLFESGTFLLIMTFFWILTSYVTELNYTDAAMIAYPTYLLIFIFSIKKLINNKAVTFTHQVRTLRVSLPFLGFSIAEYVCFWGVVLISGMLLSSQETGVISWGTRVFQLFVFFVGIKNSLDVPRILQSSNVKEELHMSVVENTKQASILIFVSLLIVFSMYLSRMVSFEIISILSILVFFYFSATLRYSFGPICHVFTSISSGRAIIGNLMIVSIAVVIGSILIRFFGVYAVGPVYFSIWAASLVYSYLSIYKVGYYNNATN